MKRPPKPPPPHWYPSPTYEGRDRGDEFTFLDHDGKMRRARFLRHVTTESGQEWLDCVEVTTDGVVKGGVRSIRTTMVRKWWRKKKKSPTIKAKRQLRKKGPS